MRIVYVALKVNGQQQRVAAKLESTVYDELMNCPKIMCARKRRTCSDPLISDVVAAAAVAVLRLLSKKALQPLVSC